VVDTKALLKGFGAAADVAGQIATDKAINSRRVRSNFSQFDITNGQLIEDATVNLDSEVPHQLGRTPSGAAILKADMPVVVTGSTASSVTLQRIIDIELSIEMGLDSATGAVVTLWVV
jgi:hypothetical protein